MTAHNLWIEVDIQKIKNNLTKIKSVVGEAAHIMAIVKANAYGHGMIEVARALADMVSYFGVSTFAEGEQLRRGGILSPILILGSVLPDEYARAIEHDVTLSVSDREYAEALNQVGKEKGKRVKVHIKVDTGMGRWGFVYRDAFQDIQYLAALPFLNLEGMFTHFSVSDSAALDYTERQIELFKELRVR